VKLQRLLFQPLCLSSLLLRLQPITREREEFEILAVAMLLVELNLLASKDGAWNDGLMLMG